MAPVLPVVGEVRQAIPTSKTRQPDFELGIDGLEAVRCAMLVREQGRLDQVGEETVCLTPLLTDPVFV